MSTKTKIEWTQMTWNPMTGCTKVSPGCKHCYAEVMAKRLKAMGTPGYENGFDISILPMRLVQPLKRKKPTIYFVNSTSDLFHEDAPFSFLDDIFNIIAQTPQHTYQILSKRAERMAEYFSTRQPPENAWLDVSVENKQYGLPRIDYLRNIPTKVRFLSVEPLLEDLGTLNLSQIHWVIVGGESGSNARPMQPGWVENIKDQCDQTNASFFFKQWGGWGADGKKRHKKKNGRILQGRTWDEMPSISSVTI